MNEIDKFLALMKRKEKRLMRTIWGVTIHMHGEPKKVLNTKMIHKKSALSYEQCLEVKMTKAQQEVFFFVDEFWKKYGIGPTMREITKFRGSRSLGSTHEIVGRLIKLGILKKMAGMERSVRPVYINFRTLDALEEPVESN